MSLYASTLIIRYKTDKSDAELLRMLDLHKKTTHVIGSENVSYYDTLSNNTQALFITSTEEYVILTGFPLISDFTYINPYSSYFPDAEFFFFFSESVSMLNGYVWGKGSTIHRRKYVQDGKYAKAYDIEPDVGTPLAEELKYFNYEAEDKVKQVGYHDYIYGIHDLDIAWEFLRNHFLLQGEAFLEPLVFNRDINATLKDYIEESNKKVEKKDIDATFKDRFKVIAKEFKFKKINTPGTDGKIVKDSYYRKYNGFTIYIVAEKQLSMLPLRHYLSFEMDAKDQWITENIRHHKYGVALLSFQPSLYLKLDGTGNEYIYTAKDMDIVIAGFEIELVWLREFMSFLNTHSLQELFTNEEYYRVFLDKLNRSVTRLGRISNTEEINFCLLYYYFSKRKDRAADLINLLDQVRTEANKGHVHQVVSRKAIASL